MTSRTRDSSAHSPRVVGRQRRLGPDTAIEKTGRECNQCATCVACGSAALPANTQANATTHDVVHAQVVPELGQWAVLLDVRCAGKPWCALSRR